MALFVGRAQALARLTTAFRAVAEPTGKPGQPGQPERPQPGQPGQPQLPQPAQPERPRPGQRQAGRRRAGLVLVAGEAGIGKTALLARFAGEVAALGADPAWGTCWDDDRAPAFWPWTQVLRTLLDERPSLLPYAEPALAAVIPGLAGGPPGQSTTGTAAAGTTEQAGRVQVFDAVSRLLSRASATGPVIAILDDLQWSDPSTLELLRFLTGQTYQGGVLLVGAYRPDELPAGTAAEVAALASAGERLALAGLAAGEIAELVASLAGDPAASRWADLVHARTAGHPFFARELSQLVATGDGLDGVPIAVREVIARKVSRLSGPTATLLTAASVAGTGLLPDVLAAVTGEDPAAVAGQVEEAGTAGLLVTSGGSVRFAHDLYRESIYASTPPGQRLELHSRIAAALRQRHERGAAVFPAELARHHLAAAPVTGVRPALPWAWAAAAADRDRFAFAEAAGHLSRLREAGAGAGEQLPGGDLVDVLGFEADLRLRAGDADQARQLLDLAWARAVTLADPDRIGAVALGLDQLGARFAMPRTELVAVLDQARHALTGTAGAREAQVTAALARQLQHSVPRDRPRAGPLAERAVVIARTIDDPATLASCLLAQHDVLWTPGTAARRAAIAEEIAALAERAADPERRAQGLLLAASARLESGSPGFRAAFDAYEHLTRQLRQPRHEYLLRTRQAALALLAGDIDTGDRLSAEAAELGESVGDTDAGNVRMSQRLEVARASGGTDELRETAAAAVRWWVGAPAHAHAVAAGFLARAGDLDAARGELDIVMTLDDLRTDRSYLWSVFAGELAVAAIAVDDRLLCTRLLDDLLPIAGTCAVNGALVCFMGAHAHRVGCLYAALGQPEQAREWLGRALDTHRRLGARAWEAETAAALATLDGAGPDGAGLDGAALPATASRPEPGQVELIRVGDMWRASFAGKTAFLRDAKGLHDLATLLARPGVDLPALELAGGAAPEAPGAAVLDRTALSAYRRRLSELDEELAEAEHRHDTSRRERAAGERETLLAELRRSTRPGAGSRTLGATAAERARKAVTARIRDAIRRIEQALPPMGRYLDRAIRTGTTCRYDPPR